VSVATAQPHNPGDPLFCQPHEGNGFLIVNGGAGVFTADGDCWATALGSSPANTPPSSIATGQGGLLTLANPTFSGGQANYVYTPPTPNFTGNDTFSIAVSTVWNAAGGLGSAGGSARPGGPATIPIILNVIPSTATLSVAPATPTLVPIPTGTTTGCQPSSGQGNSGAGPPPGAISGCVTKVIRSITGGTNPGHGTLSTSGNTLLYTPNGGFAGSDTFSYEARGINTDGPQALSSGNVLVTVTAPATGVPTVGTTGLIILAGLLVVFGLGTLARGAA
jgi:hypothetical protein